MVLANKDIRESNKKPIVAWIDPERSEGEIQATMGLNIRVPQSLHECLKKRKLCFMKLKEGNQRFLATLKPCNTIQKRLPVFGGTSNTLDNFIKKRFKKDPAAFLNNFFDARDECKTHQAKLPKHNSDQTSSIYGHLIYIQPLKNF